MAFYKLFCKVYRRTDYHKLDRIRRELMYPEYYAEKKKRTKDALMKLMIMKSFISNAFDHERW